MTKKELVDNIIKTENISKKQCESIIDVIFENMINALKRNEEISIHGFGKFSISNRAARDGVNPSTGDKIKISASKTVKFKQSKQLKEIVNTKKK